MKYAPRIKIVLLLDKVRIYQMYERNLSFKIHYYKTKQSVLSNI